MGAMKFTISCLLDLQTLHIKFGLDWPSSSGEEDLKNDARRTTTDAHPLQYHSGALKSIQFKKSVQNKTRGPWATSLNL